MKNKIRCLFDKIKSEDLLGIFGICICALLIFTMVFAPISASAYGNNEDAFLFIVDDNAEQILGVVTDTNLTSSFSAMYEVKTLVNTSLENKSVEYYISHSLDDSYPNGVNALNINGTNYPLIYYGNTVDGTPQFYTDMSNILPSYSEALGMDYCYFIYLTYDETITTPTYMGGEIHLIFNYGSVGYNACNFNRVFDAVFTNGGTPNECPTLQTQINQYQGTWDSFEGMLLGSTNEVIYQGYRDKLQELFRQGQESVTLESLLADYDGSFQQLITLLSENNLRLLDEYAEFVEQIRDEEYNEGYYIGEENGYKNGYNSGLNKCQSDTFTKNFFTDFLGGVVEAIDSIHLYEHIREIDGGVSTVVEWYISPWTIFTSMICLIVVIIILKVWLGG